MPTWYRPFPILVTSRTVLVLLPNDPSAVNIITCVCRTLHVLSVDVFVAFIGCLLLILCSLKSFFCAISHYLGYIHTLPTAAAAAISRLRLSRYLNAYNPPHPCIDDDSMMVAAKHRLISN